MEFQGGVGELCPVWLAQFPGFWMSLGLVKVLGILRDFLKPMLINYFWLSLGSGLVVGAAPDWLSVQGGFPPIDLFWAFSL